MEKFKAYEREAKTKAYSKEGLQSQRERAKKQDGRAEITGWLRRSIDALKVQIDTLELQLEADAKKKKGNDVGRNVLERHNFHLDALEKILRLWENQAVSKEEVRPFYLVSDHKQPTCSLADRGYPRIC
jgi:CCR4-NOT transcription complex subunit 3